MAADGLPLDQGHYFTRKNFHKPTYCHLCTDLLWGLIGQGLSCKVCNYVIHERCRKEVVTPCTSYLTDHIKNPLAHCWSDVGTFKKKFCNVCRRRLEDSPAHRCEVCEYYAHIECKDFTVSDCRECATYTPHIDQDTVVHFHHWREGNLPSSSKCYICKKTCWSGDCLTGYRCEWCGVTAHSNCMKKLPAECHFGTLRKIFLPPYCVTVPRLDFSIETILSFTKSQAPVRTISDDWSSIEGRELEESNGSASGAISNTVTTGSQTHLASSQPPVASAAGQSVTVQCPTNPTKSPNKQDRDDYDKFHVYDGNEAYRNNSYHSVNMSKNASAGSVLSEALRVFHMPPEPDKYYLCLIGLDDDEIRLDERYPIRDQMSLPLAGSVPSLYIRKKEKERGELPIYIDSLLPLQKKSNSNCEEIAVNRFTTSAECMEQALARFGFQDEDISKFVMTTVSVDKAVNDHTLEPEECPFDIIQNIAKESLRKERMTRFYLQLKEDPHGSVISVFVGNLPISYSQRQYAKILEDIIGKEYRWQTFDAIYYEYGSLVITYHSRDKAIKVFQLLQNASFDDKLLYVMLLPNIQTHMIPDDSVPLLVFVNTRSGGCQGQQLITWFRKALNPHQVFDLSNGGPLPGLYVFRNVKQYRILVCGGDGTVGWALQCLDNVGQDAVCESPPIAVLPLGTGNDLARVLRWGPGYSGAEDLMSLLHDIIDAEDIRLDRWTVIFHPETKETDETKVAMANETQVADTNEDKTQMFVMNNYMGFGIDAELSLDFHNARQKNPGKFISRLHNKGVYFKMSIRKMTNRPSKPLNQFIKLEVDGQPVELPQIEGLIILNILSWAAGANPWGSDKDESFLQPNHWDGLLEVVGVTGVVHMGKISGGLSGAIRLAQGGHIKITMLDTLPIHIDGEPWNQPKGQCVILKSALKATMLKKCKGKVKRRNTEPNISYTEAGAVAASHHHSTTSEQ